MAIILFTKRKHDFNVENYDFHSLPRLQYHTNVNVFLEVCLSAHSEMKKSKVMLLYKGVLSAFQRIVLPISWRHGMFFACAILSIDIINFN